MTETPSEITISDLIRGAMAMRGYVQRDLAEVLGLSQNTVSDKLGGSYDWRISELQRIASWLQVDVGTLATATPWFVTPTAAGSPVVAS